MSIKSGIGAKLEQVGSILALGFGDRFAVGVIVGMISDVTPMQCYDSIINKTDLTEKVDAGTRDEVRRIAKNIDLDAVNTDMVLKELRNKRLDLLSIIINTPGGVEWVSWQIEKARSVILMKH